LAQKKCSSFTIEEHLQAMPGSLGAQTSYKKRTKVSTLEDDFASGHSFP
jgi:hypothetical protein